jgi:hypothetical protein
VTRQRRCSKCGFQWFSVEIVVDDDLVQLTNKHYHTKPWVIREIQRAAWGVVTSRQNQDTLPRPYGSPLP